MSQNKLRIYKEIRNNRNAHTKLVIRRMPPNFTMEVLLEKIGPLADHNYKYFVSTSNGCNEASFSRAYINFLRVEDLVRFKEKFDNYPFYDEKGVKYPAVVEFAPYQEVPSSRVRRDGLAGTIFYDEYYLRFVESLKKAKQQMAKRSDYDFQFKNNDNNSALTPLLKYIRERKGKGGDGKGGEYYKKKGREKCVVFVNSTVKGFKYGAKFNKKKHLYKEIEA